jgi:hypothetical protein
VTNDDVIELKRELTALDLLLDKLAPQDDLSRLAMDPKRQQAAATMVGTIVLARDLLSKARTRLNGSNGTSPNGTERTVPKRRGEIAEWLLNQIDNQPVAKADVIAKAKEEGFGYASVYAAMNKLEEQKMLKSKKLNERTHHQAIWKVK